MAGSITFLLGVITNVHPLSTTVYPTKFANYAAAAIKTRDIAATPADLSWRQRRAH